MTAEEESISGCDIVTHTNTISDDHNLPSQEAFEDILSDLFSNDLIIQNAALDEAIFPSWDSSLSVSNSPSHINSHATTHESSALDPSPYHELTMPLVEDPNISLLLHHYQTHVADLLQPVFHDRNPWRTTYFPFALQGCPDSIMAQIPQAPSGVFSSLFHSLISAAAFHLRNLLDGSPKYHKIGLQHRAKALQALNSSIGLVTPARPEQYMVYITAMLALVTIDVSGRGVFRPVRSSILTRRQTITGEDSDFPVHLKGCRQLQKLQLDCQLIDGPTRQVNSISHFLSLLTRTTTYDLEPKNSKIDSDLLKSIHFDVNDWSIEYMYGITPTLGNLLKKTCQAAERLSFYQDQDIPLPLLETCTAIEDRLLSWNIDSETLHLMGSKEQTMREIVYCQARAFHSAIAIFYYRTIEPSRSVNLENYVETIWENLKRAEDLKDEYLAGEKRAAPMSWPAFIAACEASDRKPWVEWWERMQGYALGNFTRQWRTIREIWSIMDENKNVGSWREALRQSGKLVLPI